MKRQIFKKLLLPLDTKINFIINHYFRELENEKKIKIKIKEERNKKINELSHISKCLKERIFREFFSRDRKEINKFKIRYKGGHIFIKIFEDDGYEYICVACAHEWFEKETKKAEARVMMLINIKGKCRTLAEEYKKETSNAN